MRPTNSQDFDAQASNDIFGIKNRHLGYGLSAGIVGAETSDMPVIL
jgi:hypothetical protein